LILSRVGKKRLDKGLDIKRQKIEEFIITTKSRARVRSSGKVVGLDSELFIKYEDGTTNIKNFDYEHQAEEYISKEWQKCNVNKTDYEEESLF